MSLLRIDESTSLCGRSQNVLCSDVRFIAVLCCGACDRRHIRSAACVLDGSGGYV